MPLQEHVVNEITAMITSFDTGPVIQLPTGTASFRVQQCRILSHIS